MKALTYTFKHLIILIVGVALALVFALMSYGSKDLSASVLSLQEREFITQAQRDTAYKSQNQQIEIFISAELQRYNQLFISLLFSPSEIMLNENEISSPYSHDILSISNSSLLLKVSEFWAGNVDEGIVIIPFQGEEAEITVEFVSDEIQGGQLFAVGALKDFDSAD